MYIVPPLVCCSSSLAPLCSGSVHSRFNRWFNRGFNREFNRRFNRGFNRGFNRRFNRLLVVRCLEEEEWLWLLAVKVVDQLSGVKSNCQSLRSFLVVFKAELVAVAPLLSRCLEVELAQISGHFAPSLLFSKPSCCQTGSNWRSNWRSLRSCLVVAFVALVG